jgi:DNA-binding beta-propeller fold protein YncE
MILMGFVLFGCPDDSDWGKLGKIGYYGEGIGEFNTPCGIFMEQIPSPFYLSLFVADYGNNRIQVLSQVRDTKFTFGNYGTEPGQFNGPMNVTVTRSNFGDSLIPLPENQYIFVVDSKNHRIQKFDLAGNFILEWGRFGNDTSEFNTPIGIDIDFENNIYVVDSGNHRIQVFDSLGNFKIMWGGFGAEEGYFDSPIDITVLTESDYETLIGLAVSDYGNNRIQVFNKLGDFIQSFNNISEPLGISSMRTSIVAISGTKRLYEINFYRREIRSRNLGEMIYPYDLTVDFEISDRQDHSIYIYGYLSTY